MKKTALWLLRRYRLVVLLALVVTAASVLCAGRIRIVTDAKEMLPQDNPYVQSFNRITEDFSSATLLITVEGEDRRDMIDAARSLAEAIQGDFEMAGLIETVNLQVDREFLYRWALMMQDSADLEKTLRLFEDFSAAGFFRLYNDNLEDTYSGEEGEDEIDSSREERETAGFLAGIGEAATLMRLSLEDPSAYPPEATAGEVADFFLTGDTWNFDRRGSMLVFSIVPAFQIDDIEETMVLMEKLDGYLQEAGKAWPGLIFGYAGDVPQNYDEQIALGSDAVLPSILALLVILVLFLFSFRSIRVVVMAIASLILGILATVLVVALTIGSLNLLTSLFAVLLIGLGIDFGIHFITNYDRFRGEGMENPKAISATYRSAGKAVALGAIATAIAFFSLLLTGSPAIRQFGAVAGTGVLLTLGSELIVLPALILLFPESHERKRRLPVISYRGLGVMGGKMKGKGRWIVPAIVLICLALLVPNLGRLGFVYDLSELGPQNSVSVRTQRKIEEKFGLSPLPVMVSTKSLEEARRLTEEVKEVPSVGAVSSVTELIREEAVQDKNLLILAENRAQWQPSVPGPLSDTAYEDLLYEIQRLEWNMIEIGDLSVTALGEGNMVQMQRDEMIREVLGAETGEPGREVFRRLLRRLETVEGREGFEDFQKAFAEELNRRARLLLSPDRRLTEEDIPVELRGDMLSADKSSYLLVVSPDSDSTTKEGLHRFRAAMEEIDPGFTGTIPIFVEWTHSISSEVGKATALIALVFTLLMLVSFRSIQHTLIASACLGSAALLMFGLFPPLGIRFNATNIMILPLIFGLGIAFQIHIIHRFLQVGDVETALERSGKGVLLSGLTTMIGFGSLGLIGAMKAAQQLGLMLFVGIGINLIIAFTLLPALLSWIDRPVGEELHTDSRKGELG